MTAELRYAPGTEYGDKFPSWVIGTFPDAATAEAVRVTCPSAASIEVVEVPA